MTWREHARQAAERRLRSLAVDGAEPRGLPDPTPVAEVDEDAANDRVRIRTGPWSSAAVRGLALLTLIAIAVAGYLLWQAQPRSVAPVPEVMAVGEPITGNLPEEVDHPVAAVPESEPAPEPVPPTAPGGSLPPDVIVHVAGQVAHPGLVRLPGGSRVADAVEAAGGVTRPRAADSVNLARLVVDGEQIVVGGSAGAGGTGGASVPDPGTPGAPLDLNSATVEQFDSLPGVGPVIAGRIVEWRTVHGRFRSIEELAEVSGIGEAILANLRPLVRL